MNPNLNGDPQRNWPIMPPPPPYYGFHNLERRTIALFDGTVRSYFAHPPDVDPIIPFSGRYSAGQPGLGLGFQGNNPNNFLRRESNQVHLKFSGEFEISNWKSTRISKEIFLPHDIVTEILSRLPVKSLIRFRCVCKQWCSLTFDPYFLQLHHERARNRPRIIGSNAMNRMGDQCRTKHCSLDMYHGSYFGIFSNFVFSNFVNGLACAFDSFRPNSCVYLMNPAIRQFLKLPENPRGDGYGFGLGFDASSGEYKMVMLFAHGDSRSTCCDILTLGTRHWRCIGQTPFRVVSWEPVLLHGALHWMAIDVHDKTKAILTLDVSDEKFGQIPVPKTLSKRPRIDINDFKGNLSVVDCVYVYPVVLTIWIMKDYAGRKWTKAYSFDTTAPVAMTMPKLFHVDDEKMWFLEGEGSSSNIYRLDLRANTVRRLDYDELLNCRIHTESLFWLERVVEQSALACSRITN